MWAALDIMMLSRHPVSIGVGFYKTFFMNIDQFMPLIKGTKKGLKLEPTSSTSLKKLLGAHQFPHHAFRFVHWQTTFSWSCISRKELGLIQIWRNTLGVQESGETGFCPDTNSNVCAVRVPASVPFFVLQLSFSHVMWPNNKLQWKQTG